MRRTKKDSEIRGFRTHLGVVMRSVAAITASVTLVATGLSGDVTPASAANSTPDHNETNAAGAADNAARTDNDTKKKESADSSKDDSTKDSVDAATKLSKAVDQWADAKDNAPEAAQATSGAADSDTPAATGDDRSAGTPKDGQSTAPENTDRAAKVAPLSKKDQPRIATRSLLGRGGVFGRRANDREGFFDHGEVADPGNYPASYGYTPYLEDQCTEKDGTTCTYYPDEKKLFTPKQGKVAYKYDSSRVCGTAMKVLVDTSTAVSPEEMYQQKQAIYQLMRRISGTKTTFSLVPFARSVKPAEYTDGESIQTEPSQFDPVPSNNKTELDKVADKVSGLTAQSEYTCGSHYPYGTQCDPHATSSYLTYFRGANYQDAFAQVEKGDSAILIGEGKPTAPFGRSSVMDIQDIQGAREQAKGKHIWSFITGTSQRKGGQNLWFDNYGQMAGPQLVYQANGKCPMTPLVGTGGKFGIGTNPDDQNDAKCGSTKFTWPWKANSAGKWQIDQNNFEAIPGVGLLAFADINGQLGYPDTASSGNLLWMSKDTLNGPRVRRAWINEREFVYDPYGNKVRNIYWGYGANGVSLMSSMTDRVDVVAPYGSSPHSGETVSLPDLVAKAGEGCDPAQVTLTKAVTDDGDKSGFTFVASNILPNYEPPASVNGDLNSDNYDKGVGDASTREEGSATAESSSDGSVSYRKSDGKAETVFYAKPVQSSDLSDGDEQTADNSQQVTFTESDNEHRGYVIDSVKCTGGENPVVEPHGQTFTVKNLHPGEHVSCTVTNRPIPSDFSITKTPVASDSVKQSNGNYTIAVKPDENSFNVTYKVTVTNEAKSGRGARPELLKEAPASIPGYKATEIKFTNPRYNQLIDNRYLRNSYYLRRVLSHDDTDNSWTLTADGLNYINPGNSASTFVTVTYSKDESTSDTFSKLLIHDPKSVLSCQSAGGENSDSFVAEHGLINDVSTQKEYRGSGNNPNPVHHAQACVTIEPGKGLSVDKEPYNDDSQVVAWVGSNSATGEYLVTVKNEGPTAVRLSKLVESPKLPRGFTSIKSVDFAPVDGNKLGRTGKQLVDEKVSVSKSTGDNEWVLPSRNMNDVPAASTAGAGKALVKVIVHYSVNEKKTSFYYDKQNWTCQGRGHDWTDGRGAINDVSIYASDTEEGSSEACLNVKQANIEVEKYVNNRTVSNREKARLAFVRNDTVHISYRITNNGEVPLSKIAISDTALDADGPNRYDSTSDAGQIPIKNLNCGDHWSQESDRNGDLVFVGDSALQPYGAITCSWDENKADLVGSGKYSLWGDRVTVSGTPDVFEKEVRYPSDTDTAWFRYTPKQQWILHKEGGETVIIGKSNVGGDDRQDVVVSYTISLNQTGNRIQSAKASAIIEKPGDVDGFTISKVEVVMPKSDSLVTTNISELEKAEDGGYVIESKDMNDVGSDPKKAIVKVHYRANSGIKLTDFSAESLTCDEGSNGGFNNLVTLKIGDSSVSREDPPQASACDSGKVITGKAVKKINDQESTSEKNSVLIVENDGQAQNATITYEFTNNGTVPLSTIGISDRLVAKNGRLGNELLSRDQPLSCVVNGRTVGVYATRGKSYTSLVAFPSKLAVGDKVTCTTTLTNKQMGFVDGDHHDRLTITPCEKQGFCGDPVTDDGWATKVPPLVGNLPKTGGSGVGLYGVLSLTLIGLGGYFAAATRRRRS